MNANDLNYSALIPESVGFNSPGLSSSSGASNPVGSYLQTGGGSSSLGSNSSSGGLGGVSSLIPGLGGSQGNSGLGFNLDTLNLALGGLQTIGNIWNAFQAQKLAKEQFKFTKDVTETNLTNQIKSYNTALSDRSNSRAFTEGRDQASSQAYIDENKLSR